MERQKHILSQEKSKIDVNRDDYSKLNIDAKERLLPVGDINEIVNVADRFNLERQSSTYYRINGTVNSLLTNVLFNTTGTNSWSTFMTPPFRDRSYPPNGVDLDEEEDLTYRESITEHLQDIDGWMGYADPNIASLNPCAFTDMEPNRTIFSLTPQSQVKNWDLVITYPYRSVDGYLTQGGLLVVDKREVLISGRRMTAFGVPVKHNLTQGSNVRISGVNPISTGGDYPVSRLGLDNGDAKLYYFCLDIDPDSFTLSNNTRMVRVVNGKPSSYYYRKFKKVQMRNSPEMENDDYEIYPLAFSNNIFNDKINQFVINEDVDISGLVDNLGRPLSELYVTFMKIPNNGFTAVKSGIEMPFIDAVGDNKTIPDVRRITNDGANTHLAMDSNVRITDTDFYGDIVEFNQYELSEITLAEVMHRFNTTNRDSGGSVYDSTTNETINLGNRYEGYIYKPHYKLQIRSFSSYIEQGDESVVGIPDYAQDLGDGRFIWRDLMDIGANDVQQNTVDYPFLNGSHYLHKNITFCVKRQDPFAKYGLYYGLFPRDGIGNTLSDNYIVKKVEDVC